MKKNFFKSIGIFFRSLPEFILFELLFKLVIVAVGSPFLTFLLKITMKISDVNYISGQKVWTYLKNPATLIAIILVLFFTAVFTFVEISALTSCFLCFTEGRKATTSGMFRAGLDSLKKLTGRNGIIEFLKFMSFMPLVQFTLSSCTFTIPLLPVLRKVFGTSGAIPVIAYIATQIILLFLMSDYSYSVHYMITTDEPFSECIKKSRDIIREQKKKHALSVIGWSLFVVFIIAAVTFAISFLVLLFIKGFSNPEKAFLSALKVMNYTRKIFTAISSFFVTPAIICRLTGKFFADVPEDEKIILPDYSDRKTKKSTRVIIFLSMATVSVLLNYNYIEAAYKDNLTLNVDIFSRTQITAHRGFSHAAPENTMYAFEYALESGADYIELDVQLTADGQLVVFHDEKLDRVTDGSGRLRDFTFDELSRLSAGCKFRKSEDFKDARIPLLSEVFEEFGDDILYNIEIKNKGDSKLATERTIELIEKYDIEDSCYITSFSYDILKQVKRVDPKIKTGLISNSFAPSSLSYLPDVDALSINYMLINSAMVNTAHYNGKRVFAWTVDKTADIQKMESLGVDNIITNRPDRTAELIYSKSVSDKILMILKVIFNK